MLRWQSWRCKGREKISSRISTESFKGERDVDLNLEEKNHEEQQYFKQSWHEEARKPLLGVESRFMLDSTLQMATLGCYSSKESPPVNLQLVLLSLLTVPGVWHPSPIFCCLLVANIQLKFLLMSSLLFFFCPGKAQQLSSFSVKELSALASVPPHLPAEISDFSLRAPLFFTSFHLLCTFHQFSL